MFAWIFFRSESLGSSFSYIERIFNSNYGVEKIGLERYSFEILPLVFLQRFIY